MRCVDGGEKEGTNPMRINAVFNVSLESWFDGSADAAMAG
jgi:hypothetical protein